MQCRFYDDVRMFHAATHDLLLAAEAQNMILLGNLYIGFEGKDKTGWRDPLHWVMATVSRDDAIVLIALMTPPHNIVLYSIDNIVDEEALSCLIDRLREHNIPIPGVMAEEALVQRFAELYAKATGTAFDNNMRQRIYVLTEIDPAIPVLTAPLRLRTASAHDLDYLPLWDQGFGAQASGYEISLEQAVENARYATEHGLFILEDDGVPVCMTRLHREMRTVCGIGYVYTPPQSRGRGYATACVAEVSRIALQRGFSTCVLYTDLANPTSNSIYQKIGYKPLCDSKMIRFVSTEQDI